MSKASILIALTLVAFSCTVHHATAAARGRFIGGRTQVYDVRSNKEVQELGRFSVHDYNLSGHLRWPTVNSLEGRNGAEAPLRFVKVVEAEKQVVAGVKYFLKVEAVQAGERRVFDAEVVVKPWLQSKQLLNFGPSTKLL